MLKRLGNWWGNANPSATAAEKEKDEEEKKPFAHDPPAPLDADDEERRALACPSVDLTVLHNWNHDEHFVNLEISTQSRKKKATSRIPFAAPGVANGRRRKSYVSDTSSATEDLVFLTISPLIGAPAALKVHRAVFEDDMKMLEELLFSGR